MDGGLPPSVGARGLRPLRAADFPQIACSPQRLRALRGKCACTSRVVTLDGTSRTVVVEPRPHAMRTVGLAVGILGPAMIAGGIAIGAANKPVARLCAENTPCPVDYSLTLTAVSLVLTGLALTPIGWTVFGKSYVPRVVVTSPVTQPRVTGLLGVVPVRGGAAISGVLTF